MDEHEERKIDLIFSKTQRGFRLIEFRDLYRAESSLQESSLASEAAVWLGTKDNRMHLSIEHAQTLVKLLNYFIETGYLPDSLEESEE